MRVHPELLAKEKIPSQLLTEKVWEHRFEDIRNFERYLTRNGVVIRKFFLNVSAAEQKRRFLERLDKSGEKLEIFVERRPRARFLERLHEGL